MREALDTSPTPSQMLLAQGHMVHMHQELTPALLPGCPCGVCRDQINVHQAATYSGQGETSKGPMRQAPGAAFIGP
jgi:hypothetical protein